MAYPKRLLPWVRAFQLPGSPWPCMLGLHHVKLRRKNKKHNLPHILSFRHLYTAMIKITKTVSFSKFMHPQYNWEMWPLGERRISIHIKDTSRGRVGPLAHLSIAYLDVAISMENTFSRYLTCQNFGNSLWSFHNYEFILLNM